MPEDLPVIPPNPIAEQLARTGDPAHRETAKLLARYLDEVLRIPGTNIRFGLDPILALFPGVGDLLVSGAGGVILLEALRSGVSFSVFLRMAANMGVNFLLGLIPGAGAFFTAFYKSNSRNFAILTAWQAGHHGQVKQSTLRFFLGLLMLVAMLIGFVAVIYLVYGLLLYTAFKSILSALSW
ncbi:MAG: DUF4112 domain-containing protein [Prosthecobacter sp.]|jgi:hypothetical protein